MTVQVESEALRRLVLEIERMRPDLEVSGLSSLSAGHVRRLNTKSGGHQLMRDAGVDDDDLPPQTQFPTLPAAEAWLAAASRSNSFLLKPNSAVGGFGIAPFLAGKPAPPDVALEALRGRRRHATTWKAIGTVDDGVIVEQVVGDFGTNWSITADFEVANDLGVRLVGMAVQELKERVAYSGISSRPDGQWRRAEDKVRFYGEKLGRELLRLGYRGFFNIDVAALRSDPSRAWLIELNLRRSAPLNSFLLLERLLGPSWRDHAHIHVSEGQIMISKMWSYDSLIDRINTLGLECHPDQPFGILPYVVAKDDAEPRCAAMILAKDDKQMRGLRHEFARLLGYA
jgi:hypothetical protein